MNWLTDAASLLAGFLLPVAGLAATAWVLGRLAAGALGLGFEGRLEKGAVAAALGLALLSHLFLLLGFAVGLRRLPLLLLAAGILGLGFRVWRELPGDLRGAPGPRRGLGIAIAAAGLAPLVVLALYPPTAFDATLYHLPFARAFAESGGVPFLADRRFPVFPQANEILFAALMLFGRDVAVQGLQLLATLLAAVLVGVWARRAWPEWRPAGWLAAAVFLGSPIVVHLAATGYVEAGLTLFVTASFYALERWPGGGDGHGQARTDKERKGWLAVAALLAATAADVKYLGLFFLGAAGLWVLLAGGRSRPTAARLRGGLLFAAVAAAFLAPWYLRIYAHTGNPLFPFLPKVFGGSSWEVTGLEGDGSMLAMLARWLRLPWDVVFARGCYNQQPPFSPVLLAALPLLAWGALRDFRVRRLVLIAGAYTFVFLWLPRDSRYLVPALPLLALAAAGSLAAVVRRWPRLAGRSLAAVLCLGAFLPGWLYAGFRIVRQGPPPVTADGREAYLARKLPAYPAIAWLNRARGPSYTLWALHAENMTYFAAGRFLGDWFGPESFGRVLAAGRDAESFHRELRRLGVTHLLIPERGALGQVIVPPVPDDDAFRRRFAIIYQDPGARLYALRPAEAVPEWTHR